MAASSVILGGPPLLAGFLEKKGSGDGRFGRRNWKRRWFVLTRDKLEYFESTMAGEPLGSLVLREQVLQAPPGGQRFSLRSETRELALRTEESDHTGRQQWVKTLERTIAIAKGEIEEEEEEEEEEAAAVDQEEVWHFLFEDDEPIGLVLVELAAEESDALDHAVVAIEAVVEGGQAARLHGDDGDGMSLRAGLALVEIGAQDVRGWAYAECIPLLGERPLRLGFCRDAEGDRLLWRPALELAEEAAAGGGGGGAAEPAAAGGSSAQSIWRRSLDGALLAPTPSGDDAPLVLVLLADWLRFEPVPGSSGLQSVEVFAREPDESELRALQQEFEGAASADAVLACRDSYSPYAISALVKQFLQEWPGGLLSQLDDAALAACEDEDAALELLSELPEREQDALNAVIGLAAECSHFEKKNLMSVAELAVALAEVLHGSLEQEDVQVLIYSLIEFWLSAGLGKRFI